MTAVSPGLVGFSPGRVTGQPVLLLMVGGLVFPGPVGRVIGERLPRAAWLAIQSPLWLIGAMAVFVVQAIRPLETRWVAWPLRGWVALVALHALTILGIFIISFPTLIPKNGFDTAGQPLFGVGRQLIPPTQRPVGTRGAIR